MCVSLAAFYERRAQRRHRPLGCRVGGERFFSASRSLVLRRPGCACRMRNFPALCSLFNLSFLPFVSFSVVSDLKVFSPFTPHWVVRSTWFWSYWFAECVWILRPQIEVDLGTWNQEASRPSACNVRGKRPQFVWLPPRLRRPGRARGAGGEPARCRTGQGLRGALTSSSHFLLIFFLLW